MKVLLDEGVPKALARLIDDRGIAASAFPNRWKGMTNGALLDAEQEAASPHLSQTTRTSFTSSRWRRAISRS